MNIDNKDVIEWIIPEGSVVNVTDPDGQSVWRTMEPFWVKTKENTNGGITISNVLDGYELYFFPTSQNNTWTQDGWNKWEGDSIRVDSEGVYLNVRWSGEGEQETNVLKILEDFSLYSEGDEEYIIGGNILSLVDGYKMIENNEVFSVDFSRLPDWSNLSGIFSQLFIENKSIINAAALVLPLVLEDGCCEEMFYKCSKLSSGPILPAIKLKKSCYKNMFVDCESLTATPILPATILAPECYDNMFNGCTGLVTPPALPATTLVDYCYMGMFTGCDALKKFTCNATEGLDSTDCMREFVSDNGSGDERNIYIPNNTLSDYVNTFDARSVGWEYVEITNN